MNRKVYGLFSLILVLILVAGCSSEKKALEQGEEALANEQLEEAKAYFETAVEKGNNEKAKEYLQVIDLAEQFVELTENEKFDEASELLEELKEHTLYSKIRFHTQDSEALVQEVITQRQKISTEIELLNDLFKADGQGFVPDDAYFDKLDELLNEKYISEEQIAEITKMREAAEKKLQQSEENSSGSTNNNNNNQSENNSQENQNGNDEPEQNQTEQDSDKNENNNESPPVDDSEDKEGNDDVEDSNTSTISTDEAQSVLYDFLSAQYSQGYLDEPNIHINFDHEDGGKYYFQFFEVMDGRTQTIGWFTVDQKTKKVEEVFN